MQMLLELSGPIPLCSFTNRYQTSMENVPGVSSWLSYRILVEYEWKLVRELRGRISSHFSVNPFLKINGGWLAGLAGTWVAGLAGLAALKTDENRGKTKKTMKN